MSDKAELVLEDELQEETESAELRQSRQAAAAAADGLIITPPRRLIRSYDGEVVDRCQDAAPPPPYIYSVSTAGAYGNSINIYSFFSNIRNSYFGYTKQNFRYPK